jgi:L-aspartate oxidase
MPHFDGDPSVRHELQRVMTRDAGVVRSAESLARARGALDDMRPADVETANLLTMSNALVRAATAREESRGTHTRSDHPETDDRFLGRLVFTDHDEPDFVPLTAGEAAGAK